MSLLYRLRTIETVPSCPPLPATHFPCSFMLVVASGWPSRKLDSEVIWWKTKHFLLRYSPFPSPIDAYPPTWSPMLSHLHRLTPLPFSSVTLWCDTADAFDNQPWLCTSPDSPYTDSVMLPWKEHLGPVQTWGQSNTYHYKATANKTLTLLRMD